jgi:uncharacterized protein (TIGR03437 family)
MDLDASGLVSTSLAGTRVLFDGVPSPVVYATDTQVNALVPFGLQSASTDIQVQFQGQASDAVTTAVAPSAPGIFAADGSGSGQGRIFNPDGTANTESSPVAPGAVVVLYATGAGQFSPPGHDGAVVTGDSLPVPLLPVTATVAGLPAQVLYAGGSAGTVNGIIQVNLRIPDSAPGGSADVVLQIGDQTSQSGLTVSVQSPTSSPATRPR